MYCNYIVVLSQHHPVDFPDPKVWVLKNLETQRVVGTFQEARPMKVQYQIKCCDVGNTRENCRKTFETRHCNQAPSHSERNHGIITQSSE